MPNANNQRAIDRVNDKNAAVLEETTYEGMGPGVLRLSSRPRLTLKTVHFLKFVLPCQNGGRIADAGSVMFQFDRKASFASERLARMLF